MLCSLTNLTDVPLMVGYDSGRDLILCPGEKVFYDDHVEVVCEHTWRWVEIGWIKDIDECSFSYGVQTHNWAMEGF